MSAFKIKQKSISYVVQVQNLSGVEDDFGGLPFNFY